MRRKEITDQYAEEKAQSSILVPDLKLDACSSICITYHYCSNNNNRELKEHFQNLKALYNLKKNMQCTDTHNYTNQ